jgi:hypothetical protein
MNKKIKGRPDEVDMEAFFGKDNKDYNQFYGTYPKGMKVPGKPEIIFPKSLYDPVPGATINGLAANNSNMLSSGVGTIRVDTIPTGAEFFILSETGSETSFGKTDAGLTITDVDVGSYNFIIRLSGYDDYNGTAVVNEGKLCCISVDLDLKTESDQCVTDTPTGVTPPATIPPSVQGYVVLKERDVTYIVGGLMLLAGLVIGYFLLKKKE